MKIVSRKTTLCLAVAAVLVMSGCSSSNDNNDIQDDLPSTTSDTTPDTTPGTTPDTPIALPLDDIRDELIIDLAGYGVDNLSDEALLLGETIAAGDASGTSLESGSFSVDVRDESVVTPTERTSHDCSLGGTVIAEIGRQRIDESSYSNHADFDSYVFDQCRLSTDAEQLLDGTVRVLTNNVSASRGGFANREVQWTDFNWQQGDSRTVSGNALITINRLLSSDNQEGRVVTIDRFEVSNNGQVDRRIVDGSMTLAVSTVGSGFVRNFNLETQGQVTTRAGIPVQIASDQPLSASQTPEESPDRAEPFRGVISMSAADGSRLTMTAQPVRAWGPKLVDIDYVSGSGEEKTLSGEQFPELTVLAP